MSNASVLHSVIHPRPPAPPPTVKALGQGPTLLDDEVVGNDPDSMNALLNVLVENAPVAMAMFDRHMHYLLANRQWIVDFGLQESVPLLGRSQFEVFPQLHAGWRSVYDRALQGHVVRSEQDITEGPDGQPMVFRWEVRPWRRQHDADVGGVMVTCEKFTPVRLPEGEAAATGEPAIAPTVVPAAMSMVDAYLKSDLPVLVVDVDGVIQQANDAAMNLALARGMRTGSTHVWEAFGPDQDAARLRNDTIMAVAQALGSEGQAPSSIVVRDPLNRPGKLMNWAATRMDGTEHETAVMLIGLTIDAPPPAATQPAAPAVNLHTSTAALEAAHQLEKRQLEEQIAASAKEVRLLQDMEQAFKRRELRQREVMDTMPCGLLVLDERGRPIFQNAHVRDLFGRELKPGDSVEDWLTQACRNDAHREEVATIWRESVWRRQITRVVSLSTADGLLKDFEFRPAPLPSHGLLVTIHDVTESCRLEEMLRSTEAKFRALLHDAPGAVLLTDPTGAVFEANAAAERLLGRPKSELRRTSIDDWLEHESVQARLRELKQLASTNGTRAPISIDLRDKDQPCALKMARITDGEGRLHSIVHFIDLPVAATSPSAPAAPVVVAEPVAAAITTEPQQIPILRASAQGRITEWSADAEVIFGWSSDEVRQRSLHQLFRPSDATGFYFDLQNLLTSGDATVEWVGYDKSGRGAVQRYEIHRWPDGQIEFAVIREVAIDTHGGPAIALNVASPSGAHWEVADLDRERLLLTETHHRIQNHLQLISSMLNLQGNSLDNADARQVLKSSQNRVRAIAALHQHLYQLALDPHLPFRQFVDDLVSRLRDCYDRPASQVEVKVDVDEGRLREEWVLPVALILNEAVSNALKHGFQDGRQGRISITLRTTGSEGQLRIQDDGAGLPEGFSESDSVGLGLKVIGVFSDQMNSYSSLKNMAGSGVVFDLRFPITCVNN